MNLRGGVGGGGGLMQVVEILAECDPEDTSETIKRQRLTFVTRQLAED